MYRIKKLLERIIFALRMGWRARKQLRDFQINPTLHSPTLSAIDFNRFKKQGIKVLILDFDAVLAPQGDNSIPAGIETWLDNCLEAYRGEDFKVFVLSNCPKEKRIQYFNKRFPGIEFVIGAKKKPYPDGIYSIIEKTGSIPSVVLVIDDRLLTGILASVLAGVQAIFITEPLTAFKKHPVQESFFMILRFVERLIF